MECEDTKIWIISFERDILNVTYHFDSNISILMFTQYIKQILIYIFIILIYNYTLDCSLFSAMIQILNLE